MMQRKKRNSSKINLVISVIFHTMVITAVFFFAAREGMLGKKMKSLTAQLVAKEKKPEPPKEKPPEKIETAKAEKTIVPPKAMVAQAPKEVASAAPPMAAPPAAAPPSATLQDFDFHDGAKNLLVTSDKNLLYKGTVEFALRSRWNRPEGIADDEYEADVEVQVDETGKLAHYDWVKGSGDQRWDDSVKQALAQTKTFSKPPKGFPEKFMVRFDVESQKTEPVMAIGNP